MAEIRDELVLDIDAAIASIDRLESRISSTLGDVPIGVDVVLDQQDLAATQRQLDALDVDLAVDTSSFENLDQVLDRIESDTRSIVEEVDRIANAADTSDDSFRRLADSLGVSEDEAQRLASAVLDTTRRADAAENAARDLARSLGLAEGETEDLVRQMRRVASETEDAGGAAARFRSALGGLGGVLAGAVAGVGAFTAIRNGIEGAASALNQYSSLAESVNAVNVVFEDSADTILNFGQTAATSVGLANAEFNNLLVPIGAQLRNFGLDADEAAGASIRLAERAADLASVYNTDVSTALEAIQSALRGEANPIERFGASVSAAAVESFILAEGIAATKGEIDDTAKVQGRLGVILRDTARVQGDFANTSDSVANAQRILQARFTDVSASLGEALLPAYEALLDVAPTVLDTFAALEPVIAALATSFAATAAESGGLVSALGSLPTFITGVQGGLGTLGDIVGGIGDIGSGAISILTGDFDELGGQLDDFSDRFENTFERIAVQGLVSDLTEGRSAVNALGDSLLFLNRQQATAPGALINSFERLSQIAGVTDTQLEAVVENLIGNADSYQLTAANIEFLNRELFLLADGFDAAETARFSRQLDEARQRTAELAAEAEIVPTALDALRLAAEEAGVGLDEFVASADPVAQALVAAIDPATQFRLRIDALRSGAIDAAAAFDERLGGAIRSLPDILDEVGDDLDAAAERVLANIREQASAQASFEANLARLVLSGNSALANLLSGLDPVEAALAAQSFVNELDIAGAAEDVLRGQDAEIAALVAETLDVEGLIASDLNQQGIEAIAEFAAGLESPEARAQVEAAIDLLLTSLSLQELNIPVRFTAEGGFQVPVPDRITPDTSTGSTPTSTFSGTADRPIYNFETTINNPVPQATAEEAAVLEQQVGTTAALLGAS